MAGVEDTIKVENATANREGEVVVFELIFGRSYIKFAMDPGPAAFFGQWLKDEAARSVPA